MKVYIFIKSVCVVALTVTFIYALLSITDSVTSFDATTQVAVNQIQREVTDLVEPTKRAVVDLDATILDTRRTMLIAGGTLNIVRDTMRKEQKSTEAAIQSSQALVQNSTDLVRTTDQALQEMSGNVNKALGPIPLLLDQTRYNLYLLEESEKQLTPLLKNTSDTMDHVSGATADVQHEIHNFVYPPPQPWYNKYIINPMKIGLHMVTIPLTW